MLHTPSHLLISQLSFECGYSIASLSERLYCAEESEGKKMAGIFIYTASGDAEGTLRTSSSKADLMHSPEFSEKQLQTLELVRMIPHAS